MECTSLRERERERERVQKSKINEGKKKDWKKKQHMKGKMGEKCTHTHKIGQVRRKSLEKIFWTKWEWTFVAQGIWYLQVGFFFPLHLLFKLGRLQFGGSGKKTFGPQFSFPFFSLTKYTKILFSLLFFSIILKIHPTKKN